MGELYSMKFNSLEDKILKLNEASNQTATNTRVILTTTQKGGAADKPPL